MRQRVMVTAIALTSWVGCDSANLEENGFYDKISAVAPQMEDQNADEEDDVTPIEELGYIGACNAEYFEQKWQVDLNGGALRAVDWAPDGRVAVATTDNRIELLDVTSGGATVTIRTTLPIAALAFDDSGRSLITSDTTVHARLWDTADGTEIGSVAPGNSAVSAVSLSRSGQVAAAANEDGDMVVWSPTDGGGQMVSVGLAPIHTIEQQRERVVVGGAHEGRAAIELYDPTTGQYKGMWIASEVVAGAGPSAIVDMASYGSVTLAVGGAHGHGLAAILRRNNGDYSLAEVSLPNHTPVAVDILPDGEHFATVDAEGTLVVWDIHTLDIKQKIDVYGAAGVSFDPFTSALVTAGEDGVLRGFGCDG